LILIIAFDSRRETAPRIEGVVWNTSAVEDLRQMAQFKAKTRASHNLELGKISLSQAGTFALR
jgi:hypothetical protein